MPSVMVVTRTRMDMTKPIQLGQQHHPQEEVQVKDHTDLSCMVR